MSRHASPDDAPEPDDEFARLLADPDAFVRGGRHEPAARTREAVARYGSEPSSWRQSAPLAPVGPPARRRGRSSGRPQRRGRIAWAVVAVTVAASVALGLGWLHGGSATPAGLPAASARPAHSPVAPETPDPTVTASSTTAETTVEGLDPGAPVGTCYLAPTQDSDLAVIDCARAHDLELVAHEQASGPDGSFPSDAYWNGPVAQLCYADAKTYVGGEKSAWPAGSDSDFYTPSTQGWKVGDRGVFCMVRRAPAAPGTVKAAAGQGPGSA